MDINKVSNLFNHHLGELGPGFKSWGVLSLAP